MPPKKRKATGNSTAASKKVRIGGTSNISDESPTGRPKRNSVGEPQYNFTRKRKSSSTDPKPSSPTSTSVEPKKRGRPPKKTTVEVKQPERPAEARPHARVNGGGVMSATKSARQQRDALPVPAPKRRGRPPSNKGNKPTPVTTASAIANKRGRPPSIKKNTTTPAAKAPRAANKVDIEEQDTFSAGENDDEVSLVEDDNFVDEDLQYWLMKAEPESRIEKGHDVKFSIDDLASKTEPEGWDGVRNAAARNNMRAMRQGDLAFFYHSNCGVPGVAGVMRIVEEHSVDESAFDPDHPYYDAKSDPEKPKWELVKVEFVKKFDELVTLRELKSLSVPGSALASMAMLKQSRLSVSPVTATEWRFILNLAGEQPSLGQPTLQGGYETDIDSEGLGDVNDDAKGADESSIPNSTKDGTRLSILKTQDTEWDSSEDGVVLEASGTILASA